MSHPNIDNEKPPQMKMDLKKEREMNHLK